MTAAKHSILWLIPFMFAPLCSNAEWPLGRELSTAAKASESMSSLMVSGKYQIFVSPSIKGHTFMLDTDTGRVWVMRRDDTTGEFSFKRVRVEQVDEAQTTKPISGKSKPEDKSTGQR